jgi:hypothetical protein
MITHDSFLQTILESSNDANQNLNLSFRSQHSNQSADQSNFVSRPSDSLEVARLIQSIKEAKSQLNCRLKLHCKFYSQLGKHQGLWVALVPSLGSRQFELPENTPERPVPQQIWHWDPHLLVSCHISNSEVLSNAQTSYWRLKRVSPCTNWQARNAPN